MHSSQQSGFAQDARFVAGIAGPLAMAIAGVGLLSLAQYATSLTVPWISGRLTSVIRAPPTLAPEVPDLLFVALIAVLVIQSGFGFWAHWLTTTIQTALESSLRCRTYRHLQSLPLSYYHARRVGNLLSLLVWDAAQIAQFIAAGLGTLVPHMLTFVLAWLLMISIDPAAGLAAGLAVPFFVAAARWLLREMRPLSGKVAESHDRMLTHAESHLDAILLLKAFNRGAQSAEDYALKSGELAALEKRVAIALGRVQPLLSLFAGVAVVGLLWVLSRKVTAGLLGAGELVSFLMYGYFLARPMASLAGFYGQFQQTRASAARLRSLFDAFPEDRRGGRLLEHIRGEIRLRGVRYSYPQRPPVLDGFTLHIRAGETVAVVGPNGAGKSTFAHLLLRFADTESGRIEIDGQPIDEINLSSLRSHIGLVTQRVLLLDGTVADNIRFGREGASDDQVIAAARGAEAHEFIEGLPRGYETVVGERGVRLSGGQRQRIALARALLKDPSILILDEATAHFDPEAERRFLETLAKESRTRTVILITHHAAAQSIADRIVRVENGRVVDDQKNTRAPTPARRLARPGF